MVPELSPQLYPPVGGLSPLIVIVGETASGKSALALELAERYNGEIIVSDSRTVYRGLDIGTAKPSKAELSRVPHHLLDVVSPDKTFNVADFQGQALEIIKDISDRGKLPILVGGTGLYVDSILFSFELRQIGYLGQRAELEALTTEELQSQIADKGIKLPNNPQNRRHLVRAIETNGQPSLSKTLRPNTLVIGLSVPKEELEVRIMQRVEAMIENGLEAEVRKLADKYGWKSEAMSAVGYREWQAYFAGLHNMDETVQLIVIRTRQYAKRQRLWFKRNKHINWVDSADAAHKIVMNFLQQNK